MKILIIILLICVAVGIIFGVDTYNKNRYCDPISVGQNFTTSYLIQHADEMKKWSYKDIHKRIDNLNYTLIMLPRWWELGPDKTQLLALSRLRSIVVASYGYRFSSFDGKLSDFLLYTVVLEIKNIPSLWEKLGDFVRRSISLHRTRWLVVDFFSNSDVSEYIAKVEKQLEKRPDDFWRLRDEELKDWGERIWIEVQKNIEFQTKWSESQKIKQHMETDILYKQYLLYLKRIKEK